MTGALLELVAFSYLDEYLDKHFKKQQTSKFFKHTGKSKQHSKNSYEIISLGPATGSSWKFRNCGDVVKNVWLELELNTLPEDIYEIFKSIRLVSGHEQHEEFDGSWLKILDDTESLQAEVVKTTWGYKIIYPLKFELLQQYFPLTNVLSETKVEVQLQDDIKPRAQELKVMYFYLSGSERKDLISSNDLNYLCWNKTFQKGTYRSQNGSLTIPLDTSVFNAPTRDLIVDVKGDRGISTLVLRLNGHDRQEKMDSVWYRRILPREMYGVDNKRNMYYMSFDEFPRDEIASSTLNLDRIQEAILHATCEDGEYEVTVCGRVMQSVRITNRQMISMHNPKILHQTKQG